MTNDDRFDELLQQAAREHNQPPDTPRAEMWSAIASARRAGAPAMAPKLSQRAPDARIIPISAWRRRTFAWVSGLAAALFVGIVIGRSDSAKRDAPPAGAPATPEVAQAPAVLLPATTPSSPAPDREAVPGVAAAAPATPGAPTVGGNALALAPNGPPTAPIAAAAGTPDTPHGPTRNPLARRAAADGAALPYRLAAMQHLVTTEALLVALGGEVRTGRKDTIIAVWAGDLLGTTRMLIDSPAGRDPQLKQLLEDLELVLAQISRLPGARGEAADLGLIDDAVRHREIMTRLRALSPNT